MLIQDNTEEKAGGQMSVTSASCARFSCMDAHSGASASSAKTLQSLSARLDNIQKQLKAERRKLERASQMPAQVRTAAQILYCISEDEEQLKLFVLEN